MSPPPTLPAGPGYRATVSALALGQLLSWAALYYAFSSFVLPMQAELGWPRATLMGAFTLGLAVCGAATYAVGGLIDAGHGRAVMCGGALAAGLGFVAWSQITEPWMLYAAWALMGAAMAATLYEPVFNVLTKRYPERFRDAITLLTLVGGLCRHAVVSGDRLAAAQIGLAPHAGADRRGAGVGGGAAERLGPARPGAGGQRQPGR